MLTKVKGWRKIYYANSNPKKVGVAILISDKADFGTKRIIGDKEDTALCIKGSVLQKT